MAWTAPTTRIVGTLITAAIWNTDLVDNLSWLKDGTFNIAKRTIIIPIGLAATANGFVLIEDGGAGTNVLPYAAYVQLVSATTNEDAAIYCNTAIRSDDIGAFTGRTVRFIWYVWSSATLADTQLWLFDGYMGAATSPPTATNNHVGFYIADGVIWASNADGTTQKITTTGISLLTSAVIRTLRADWLIGTSVKFYVDEVLKVTHIVNLPLFSAATEFINPSLHFRSTHAASESVYIASPHIIDLGV